MITKKERDNAQKKLLEMIEYFKTLSPKEKEVIINDSIVCADMGYDETSDYISEKYVDGIK